MPRQIYLADTSVLSRLAKPAIESAFERLVSQGWVALCAPVMFELGFAARNARDYDALMQRLWSYAVIPVSAGDQHRALEIQARLAERGQHRAVSLVDSLVAAAAEAHGLTILHYDADFELIAAVTGQPQRWILTRGMAD